MTLVIERPRAQESDGDGDDAIRVGIAMAQLEANEPQDADVAAMDHEAIKADEDEVIPPHHDVHIARQVGKTGWRGIGTDFLTVRRANLQPARTKAGKIKMGHFVLSDFAAPASN